MRRFNNILCVVVSPSVSGAALERAATLANNNQARLTVLAAIDEIPPNLKLPDNALSLGDLQAKIVAEHLHTLQELVTPYTGNIEIQTKVLTGTPFLEIIRETLRNGHDLLVKTADNGGLLDRVFGSEDMHLLRKCPCPVWLVKSQSPRAYRNILVAVDVDDSYSPEELSTKHQLNLQVLEMASSLSLSEFAELHILHTWQAIGEGMMRSGFIQMQDKKVDIYVEEVKQQRNQSLNALMDEVFDKFGRDVLQYLKPKKHLLKGYSRKNVAEFARKIEADLVVMGTVARTGLPGFFMGNTAESTLNQLDCSVLAVKPAGFITPVTLEN